MADITTTSMNETCVYGVQTLETMTKTDEEWDAMKKPFKCGICDKEFMKISQINSHNYRCHTAQKIMKCDVCDKTFGHLGNYNRHRVIHTGQKPYQCDICGKGFARRSNMTRHRTCHGNRKLFYCDICGKNYTRGHSLARHTRLCHSGVKPFACDVCDMKFHQLFSLNAHKRVHIDKFKCRICSETFRLEEDLDNHLNEHRSDMNSFRCDICGKQFLSDYVFALHQESHRGVPNCRVCPGNSCRCLREKMATDNIPTENGVLKPHINQSDKVVTQSHNSGIKGQVEKAVALYQVTPNSLMPLIIHHIDGGLYQCFVCSMVFDETAQREFDIHQLKHELEATESSLIDYVCIHCDATFELASQLLEHGERNICYTSTNEV